MFVVAFHSFYIWLSIDVYNFFISLILSWLIINLKGIYKQQKTPNQYLIAGCLSGSFIYLGQVLFNFGVVATLVFFYILMALGTALSQNKELITTND